MGHHEPTEPCVCLGQGPEMTKVIQIYNKLATVLLKYEVLQLHGWSQAAERAPHLLSVTLLGRHEHSKVKRHRLWLWTHTVQYCIGL